MKSVPDTNDSQQQSTRVQDGFMERPATKGEQSRIEFPLEIAAAAVDARYNTRAVVRAAFCAGWTVKSIARGTGLSESTVSSWVRTRTAADPLFHYSRPMTSVPKMVKRVTTVPAERIEELKELHKIVATINGGTATDDPRREYVRTYGDLLMQTMREYKVSALSLSGPLGLSRVAVKLWLGRHGYINLPPSQKPYINMSAAESARINRAAR